MYLFYRGGAGNSRCDAWPGHNPGQRHLRYRCMVSRCYPVELLQYPEPFLVHVAFLNPLCTRAGRQLFACAVLSREEAAGQRRVGNDANALLNAKGFEVALVLCAVDQAVWRLQASVAGIAVLIAYLESFTKALGAVVGGAYVTHFALLYEVIKRGHSLFERSILVILMRLIEIDVIGLEACQ